MAPSLPLARVWFSLNMVLIIGCEEKSIQHSWGKAFIVKWSKAHTGLPSTFECCLMSWWHYCHHDCSGMGKQSDDGP